MTPRQQFRLKRFVDADTEYASSGETEAFLDRLQSVFKFRAYSWQAHAIQCLRNGNDVLVRAGTASGKSFVFQAMALTKPKAIVLVICPLIALMENQVRQAQF